MTRREADARCEQLNREQTGRRHWFVRQSRPDDWEVVSMSGLPFAARGPLKADVESAPRPGPPPDPRPTIIRNIPPFGPS